MVFDVSLVFLASCSATTTTSSSSASSATPAHASTSPIAAISSVVHAASSASVRLVLDLLLFHNLDNLVRHSQVLDLPRIRMQLYPTPELY